MAAPTRRATRVCDRARRTGVAGGALHAANWGQYPHGVVEFRDVDDNLDGEAVDGDTVTIDPLDGALTGPARGGYIDGTLDAHPTAAEWNAADRDERRAMLMEFRATQISFWDLPLGRVLDDVTMALST